MLILLVPAVTPEIRWVCDVLFKNFLGLDYVLRQGPARHYRLLLLRASRELDSAPATVTTAMTV